MPSPTGIWTPEEAKTGHVFDYKLAKWLGRYFEKDKSLIDLGCGPGTYLGYFYDIGFHNPIGVEGTRMDFEYPNVIVDDLTKPGLDVHYKGNVLCLEVAEHIPSEYMHTFLQNVVNHLQGKGKLIMSWAIPGQDGLGHVNCQHNIWVVEMMCTIYNLKFLVNDSVYARQNVGLSSNWFLNTLMVFTNE